MKPESVSAGGVASKEKMDPNGRGIPVQNEEALSLQCHIVVLTVKIILYFYRSHFREIALWVIIEQELQMM